MVTKFQSDHIFLKAIKNSCFNSLQCYIDELLNLGA